MQVWERIQPFVASWQALKCGPPGSLLLLTVLGESTQSHTEGNGAEVTLHLQRGAKHQ